MQNSTNNEDVARHVTATDDLLAVSRPAGLPDTEWAELRREAGEALRRSLARVAGRCHVEWCTDAGLPGHDSQHTSDRVYVEGSPNAAWLELPAHEPDVTMVVVRADGAEDRVRIAAAAAAKWAAGQAARQGAR
ncbi:MAG: hypothetical protein CMH83_18995 [Nocardioides sp.]|nr:hypothetical protein [Nocardioides sp.]